MSSEESKNPTGEYVKMGEGTTAKGVDALKIDDPNLSQEDKDHRLAIALQQQENAAAYDAHKKKREQAAAAHSSRTSRSNVHTRLANVRDRDHGMLSVPAAYTTENAYVSGDGEYLSPPGGGGGAASTKSSQEATDHSLAKTLQQVEKLGASTASTAQEILKQDKKSDEAQDHRTGRSNYHINQKGLRL